VYFSGVTHLKEIQDKSLPAEEHYIQCIIFMMGYSVHEEDKQGPKGDSNGIRIVILMSCEGSQRLLQAQYLQSDMAFKRVVGFHEFKFAAIGRISSTSKRHRLILFLCGINHDADPFGRHCILPCIC